MHSSRLLPALTLIATLLAPPVLAQGLRPSDVVAGQFRHGWQDSNGTQIVALHLQLAQNWITYWRHPGESGIAPRLDWSESENLAGVRIHWPEPRLYLKAGFNSIGYKGDLVLPLELIPEDPNVPIDFDALLSIGVCDDICIPVDMQFNAVVAGKGQPDRRIADILAHQPQTAHQAGLKEISCDLQPQKKGAMLEVHMDLPQTGRTEFLLIEFPNGSAQGHPMPSTRDGTMLTGQTYLRTQDGRLPAVDRSAISVTVVTENGAIAHQGCRVSR